MGTAVLVLRESDYDIYTRDIFAQELAHLEPGMALDFKNVRYFDSSGISVLVLRVKALHDAGATAPIKLFNVIPAVSRILTIAGLDGLFEITSTLEPSL